MKTPLSELLAEQEKEFERRFPPLIYFDGTNTIGNHEDAANEVKSFLASSNLAVIEKIVEIAEGMKKEQLDKNDPDNYGACYAIAGFNDAISKIKSALLASVNNKKIGTCAICKGDYVEGVGHEECYKNK